MSTLPEILETIVVGPDDKLVVLLPPDTSEETVGQLMAAIDDTPFHGRVMAVVGAQQLAVLRGEPRCTCNPEGPRRKDRWPSAPIAQVIDPKCPYHGEEFTKEHR